AWERRLIERGAFLSDGRALAGATYRNPETFRGCYTVLRPTFDHFLAERAKAFGATLLTETTAESLIRETDASGRSRVIGVHTTRGPVYAPLVFLAEGDASHLVAKEGLERRPTTDDRRPTTDDRRMSNSSSSVIGGR